MENKTVSVVIPAFQAENFIEDCINSVIEQTYPIKEIIIVDDGSTDSTSRIIKQLEVKYKSVKYLYQGNKKQGAARNFGIFQSTGDYIAFLDADDYWDKDFIRFSLENLIRENVNMVFSQMFVVDEKAEVIIGKKNWIKNNIYSGKDALYELALGNFIPLSTVICESSMLKQIGGFDENPEITNAEDFDLWLRILIFDYRIYSSENCLAYYRKHTKNSTIFDNTASIPASKVLLKHKLLLAIKPDNWKSISNNMIIKLLKFKTCGQNRKRCELISLVLFGNQGFLGMFIARLLLFLGVRFWLRLNMYRFFNFTNKYTLIE